MTATPIMADGKPGRPTLDDPRIRRLTTRYTVEEEKIIRAAAAEKEQDAAEFIREASVRAARRVMKESAK